MAQYDFSEDQYMSIYKSDDFSSMDGFYASGDVRKFFVMLIHPHEAHGQELMERAMIELNNDPNAFRQLGHKNLWFYDGPRSGYCFTAEVATDILQVEIYHLLDQHEPPQYHFIFQRKKINPVKQDGLQYWVMRQRGLN